MNASKLHPQDLSWCVRLLPPQVEDLLKSRPNELSVAGGYVRATIARETVSDIDIMSPTKDAALASALVLSKRCGEAKIHTTDNALTVKVKPVPVQFITRWTFPCAAQAIESFDFTIAKAAIWWDGERWDSACHPDFYADLAAKRLVYTSPVRIEEAGGSLLRVLKFYQRGYRIPLDSLAAVVARLMESVKEDKLPALVHGSMPLLSHEQAVARVVQGLLIQVDPAVDPTHEAHLPAGSDAVPATLTNPVAPDAPTS